MMRCRVLILCILLAVPGLTGADDIRPRPIATPRLPGLTEIVVDPAGRIFLAGRDGVYVLEDLGAAPKVVYRPDTPAHYSGLAILGDDLLAAGRDGIIRLDGAVRTRESIQARRIAWGFRFADGSSPRLRLSIGPEGRVYLAYSPAGAALTPENWRVSRIATVSDPSGRDVVINGGLLRLDADGTSLEVVASGFGDIRGHSWNDRFEPFVIDAVSADKGRLIRVLPGGFHNVPRGWTEADRPENLPSASTLDGDPPTCLAWFDEVKGRPGGWLVGRKSGRIDLVGKTGAPTPWSRCPEGLVPTAIAVDRQGDFLVLATQGDDRAELLKFRDQARELPAIELVDADLKTLGEELAAPEFSRRWPAHRELARRKVADPAMLQASRPVARPHWIRLAGESKEEEVSRILANDLSSQDAEVRVQALRAFALRRNVPWFSLWWLFQDESARVRLSLLETLAEQGGRLSLLAKTETAKLARAEDPSIRHLAARLMAREMEPENPHPLPPDPDEEPPPPPSPRARLAMTLADGFFLTVPPEMGPLPEGLTLSKEGTFTTAAYWKAVEKTPEREAAFRRLVRALDDGWGVIQLQAKASLERLDDPRARPALQAFRLHPEP